MMQERQPNDSRIRAADLGKKLIVFYVGDSEEELPFPNALVFRTSLRRGLRPNEFATPSSSKISSGRDLGHIFRYARNCDNRP